MTGWYVLQVKTGKEEDVLQSIRDEQNAAFSPARIMLEQRAGEWKKIKRLMLPGYVFAQLDLSVRVYEAIRDTPGVIRFLGSGMPETVAQDEMARMLLLENGGEAWDVSYGRILDEKLVIEMGPLIGWEPYITKVDARRHRAKVALTILGVGMAIELALTITNSRAALTDDTSPEDAHGDQDEADT